MTENRELNALQTILSILSSHHLLHLDECYFVQEKRRGPFSFRSNNFQCGFSAFTTILSKCQMIRIPGTFHAFKQTSSRENGQHDFAQKDILRLLKLKDFLLRPAEVIQLVPRPDALSLLRLEAQKQSLSCSYHFSSRMGKKHGILFIGGLKRAF